MRTMRLSRARREQIFVLCVLAASFAPGRLVGQQARSDSSPRTWFLTFKKGDISLHRSKTTITGQSLDGKTRTNLVVMPTEKIEIKDVNTKGDATIVETPVALEVTENGKTQKIEGASFSSTTMTVSRAGMLLKEEGDNDAGLNPLSAVQTLLTNMPVPVTPVKSGDSWKTELENRLVPGKKAAMVTTFLGTETVYGIETVKTRFSLSVPTALNASDEQTIKAEGIRNIDVKTGRLVRSELSIQNVEYTTPGGAVKGSVEVSSYLVVPGINDKEKTAANPKKL